MLGRAPEQTVVGVPSVRSARAVLAVDPASAADRHQKATAARTIERMPEPDGMESFWATMPASISRDLWATLTADAKAEQAARQQAGLPDPGLDALRVDVLVHAVLHNGGADPTDPLLTKTDPPAASRRRARHAAAAGADVLLRRRAVRRGGDRPGDPARPRRPPR